MSETKGPSPEDIGIEENGDNGEEENPDGQEESEEIEKLTDEEKERRKEIRRELVSAIDNVLKPEGFKRTSSTWHREKGETIETVYLYRFRNRFDYAIEAGAFDKRENPENDKPNILDEGFIEVRRFGDEERILNFEDESISPEERIGQIIQIIRDKVLPYLYFEWHPIEPSDIDPKIAISGFVEDQMDNLISTYTSDGELSAEINDEDVDLIIEEMRESGIDGLDEVPRELIMKILADVHRRAAEATIELHRDDKKLMKRFVQIRKTLAESQPEQESLTEKEKKERAEAIAVDVIVTSSYDELKKQSDEARASFVERVTEEFDSRGWTIPVNLFVVSPNTNDNATEHDIERYELIQSIAAEATKGTDLM